MESIVKSHFPDIEKNIMKQGLETFYALRDEGGLRKPPSTSELIDWFQILLHEKIRPGSNVIPYKGTLLKHDDDFGKFK